MDHYQKYVGVFSAVLSTEMALGVPLMNYTYDLFGTYTYIVQIFALLGAIALTIAVFTLSKHGQKLVPLRPIELPLE
jgi:ABC-type Fe3+-siderophore transport system permease subunit